MAVRPTRAVAVGEDRARIREPEAERFGQPSAPEPVTR